MSKSGKILIGCLVAVIALVLGLGLTVGGYFLWQHFHTNEGNAVLSGDSIEAVINEPTEEAIPAETASLADQLASVE